MAYIRASEENPIWVKRGGEWVKITNPINVMLKDHVHLIDPSSIIEVGQVRVGNMSGSEFTVLHGPAISKPRCGVEEEMWAVRREKEGVVVHFFETAEWLREKTVIKPL